jgi:3-mercaptopyruvate sulfurtransferase SseA
MIRKAIILTGVVLLLIAAIPAFSEDVDLVAKIDKILSKGPEHDNYHVTARQVSEWIQSGKKDFQVIDVRMPPEDGEWGQPKYGRIPGSIYIPYSELFRPENLKKLPKGKKLILVGHMSVYENYLVVPLRLIGHEAYILLLGMSGWQKDYPAVGHISMLINAANKMEFPLEKEAEGTMKHHKHKGHR